MRTVIIFLLMGLLTIVWGCALPPLDHTRQEILYEDGKVQKFSYAGDIFGPNQGPGESGQFREAIDVLREVDPSVSLIWQTCPRLGLREQKSSRIPVSSKILPDTIFPSRPAIVALLS